MTDAGSFRVNAQTGGCAAGRFISDIGGRCVAGLLTLRSAALLRVGDGCDGAALSRGGAVVGLWNFFSDSPPFFF